MYNLSAQTQGHYVIEDLHTRVALPDHVLVSTFRLSYYQPTWMTNVSSVVFYVEWDGDSDVYHYSLDTKTWFDSLDEMVASLRRWVQHGDDIIDQPIELAPWRASLTMKTLSGDMMTLDLDYANIHAMPRHQLYQFMRQQGCVGDSIVLFDEDGVKNIDTDVIQSEMVLNVLVQ